MYHRNKYNICHNILNEIYTCVGTFGTLTLLYFATLLIFPTIEAKNLQLKLPCSSSSSSSSSSS